MKELCVVPCGKRKIWDKNPRLGPQKAREVYIGPFATKCRQYAEVFYPSQWVILSAKHGFLFEKDIVPEPYEASFRKRRNPTISIEELRSQAMKKGLFNFDSVVVLGGRSYARVARLVFEGKLVREPLLGCTGIGQMMKRLNEALKRHHPL